MKINWQAIHQEEIFAKSINSEGLIFIIYKEVLKRIMKLQITQKMWEEDLNRNFVKKDTQMASK